MLRMIPNLRRASMAAGGIALSAYAIGAAVAETPVERGAYLVTTIGSCGNCHSPRDAPGHVAAGKELSGGVEFDEDVGHVVGPNITPDRETGIGAWTEARRHDHRAADADYLLPQFVGQGHGGDRRLSA
jgi:mono/diheme cytochrome c family protein